MRLDAITVFIFCRKYCDYAYVFSYHNYSDNNQAVNFSLLATVRIKQGK